MIAALRKLSTMGLSNVRARAKVLSRQNREMRANLVRIRRQAGLTQLEVAERMGVTQQAVNKLERYDADPRLSTLERYANAVGALVVHRVVRDYGQSIALASQPAWSSHEASSQKRLPAAQARLSYTMEGWSDSARRQYEVVYG